MGWEITGWLNLKSDALQQRVNQQTKHKREEHAALKAVECWSAAPDGGAGGGVGGVEAQKLYGQLLDLRESRSRARARSLAHPLSQMTYTCVHPPRLTPPAPALITDPVPSPVTSHTEFTSVHLQVVLTRGRCVPACACTCPRVSTRACTCLGRLPKAQ
jgi:hypothetical protein